MSKKIELNTEARVPKPRSLTEILNSDHVGIEFYVHVPHSTAPMHYYLYDSREDADTIAEGLGGQVFVREVSEWRLAP